MVTTRSSPPPPADEWRIEPAPAVLAAARAWLDDVRPVLGSELRAAYIVGSALAQDFRPRRSSLDVLIVTGSLSSEMLDGIAQAPLLRTAGCRVAPLIYTEEGLARSCDVFAIRLTELRSRHLLLEGHDALAAIEVPREALRRACERELRLRHAVLVQGYLRDRRARLRLRATLIEVVVGLVPLARSLLRLREEAVPAAAGRVLERVADLFGLEPGAFLFPYVMRYGGAPVTGSTLRRRYLDFTREFGRLAEALDRFPLP